MNPAELEIDLGTTTIQCTPDEIAATFTACLREMRLVARLLRADERVALRLIMSRDSGTLTVGEVFRGFTRESEGHKTLRRLRAAQFVRPAQTGRWDPDERIEVKPFARLMWERMGEAELFSEENEIPEASPIEEPVASTRGAVEWDMDDLLDLREYQDQLREKA
jgi:hypothetical protein